MFSFSKKWASWITMPTAIFCLACLMTLLFQGSRALYDPDEGRYVNVALQILKQHDWLSLHRNDISFHFTKPPLTYWILAASFKMLGHTVWAARLPIALAFILSVGVMLKLGALFFEKKPYLPALLWLLCPIPFLASHTVNTDTFLCLFILTGVFCYCKWAFDQASARYLDGMWLAFALAFLTKGPPALLPLLVILLHSLASKQAKRLFRIGGLILFVLVGLSWYGCVIYKHTGLLSYFLDHELKNRWISSVHKRSPQWYGAFTVYLPVLFCTMLPAFVIYFIQKRQKKSALPSLEGSKLLFLKLWLYLPLLIFMLCRSRLPLYILWVLPALILMMCAYIQSFEWDRTLKACIAAWICLLLGIKMYMKSWLIVSGQDSALFAQQLEQQLANVPKKIIFVESAPRFGLTFYLQADITKAALKPYEDKKSSQPYDFYVKEALACYQDQASVFLVPLKWVDSFLKEAGTETSLEAKGFIRPAGKKTYAIFYLPQRSS